MIVGPDVDTWLRTLVPVSTDDGAAQQRGGKLISAVGMPHFSAPDAPLQVTVLSRSSSQIPKNPISFSK